MTDILLYAIAGWWLLGVACIGFLAIQMEIKHYKEEKYGTRHRLKNARRNAKES